MCGRYTLYSLLKDLFQRLDLTEVPELEPRYNIAPSQTVAAIRARSDTPGRELGGRKQPYYLHMRDGSPFAFAGLWQRWEKGDAAIESCTILTTTANDVARPVHERMPVLLDPADYGTWLDPELHDPVALTPLLGPYPSHQMVAEPVSLRVNNPRSDGPDLVLPLDPFDSASSESLFPDF